MKKVIPKIVLQIIFVLQYSALFSQMTSQEFEDYARSSREGKGNGTFKVSILYLQNLLDASPNLAAIEKKFGEWQTWGGNEHGFTGNEETHQFDIPFSLIKYEFESNGKTISVIIRCEKNYNAPVKYFEFDLSNNLNKVHPLFKEISSLGYVIDRPLSRILRKEVYKNDRFAIEISGEYSQKIKIWRTHPAKNKSKK